MEPRSPLLCSASCKCRRCSALVPLFSPLPASWISRLRFSSFPYTHPLLLCIRSWFDRTRIAIALVYLRLLAMAGEESLEPFMGMKVRRRSSMYRVFSADYIDVPANPSLVKLLSKQGGESAPFPSSSFPLSFPSSYTASIFASLFTPMQLLCRGQANSVRRQYHEGESQV